MAGELTAELVAARAAEMFPGDEGEPAVSPRQPPVVKTPSSCFCAFIFAAASAISVISGKGAREDVSGYGQEAPAQRRLGAQR